MFWKKSKDKDKSKSTTTTIYRSDGGLTSASGAITSFESKVKSSANSSSSKTKITISSSSETILQKKLFSSQVSKALEEFGSVSSGRNLSLMESSKWPTSVSNGIQSKQSSILSRQKTEPTIVKRIDATPFNTKYESPYRNLNLPTITAPLIKNSATSSVTTVKTTYQSPYRATSSTSSLREKKTSSGITPLTTASTGLFQSTVKSKAPSTSTTTSTSKSTIWNPLSSIENARPTANPIWNKITISQPKITNPSSSSTTSSSAFPSRVQPKTSSVISSNPAISIRSRTPTAPLSSPSTLLTKPTSAAPVVVNKNMKKKQSPGVAYIFHNDTFDSPDKEFRFGSIEDVRVLKATFKNFKMQVNLYENQTVKQIEDKVQKIEVKNFGNASCIVIVILSHGTRFGTIAAKDGSYSIDDTVLFPILRNKSLRSKPKLLFIQACKGSMEPGQFQKDAIQPNGPPDEILKCYSTFEGYVAYRNEKGSLFIQSLCELLDIHGKTKNIKDIMDMVIRNVKAKSDGIQIPSYETTLTEPFVFGDFI